MMPTLLPSKYDHPDKTVLYATYVMLSTLMKQRLVKVDSLRESLLKEINDGEVLFLPALNVLYVIGLIEYHQKTDSIELLKNYETASPVFQPA